jgi:hypothetical protein
LSNGDPEYPEGAAGELVPEEPEEEEPAEEDVDEDRPDSQLFGPVRACRHA